MHTTTNPMNADDILEKFSLAERRVLVKTYMRIHRPQPYSKEALLKAIRGEGRWADVEGISDEEIGRFVDGARRFCELGKQAEAKRILEYLATVDPFEPAHQVSLGCLALEDSDWEVAVMRFTLAVVYYGGDLGGYAGRAIALKALGKGEEAAADLRQALELDPSGEHYLTIRMAQFFTHPVARAA